MTVLDASDYWKLRAITADLEREQTALALIQTRLETLRTKREAIWTVLVEQYHLDASKTYTARDADCSLCEA